MGWKAGSQGREKVYVHACVWVYNRKAPKDGDNVDLNIEMEMAEWSFRTHFIQVLFLTKLQSVFITLSSKFANK